MTTPARSAQDWPGVVCFRCTKATNCPGEAPPVARNTTCRRRRLEPNQHRVHAAPRCRRKNEERSDEVMTTKSGALGVNTSAAGGGAKNTAIDDVLAEHAGLELQLADPSLHDDPATARRVGKRFAELAPVRLSG